MRIDEPTGNNELGSLGEPNQPTFYKYNPQGKMVKVSQGQQNRYFLYDYLGRLIRVKQPEQEINSALDLTDTVTNNNQWTAGFEYDLVGNLKKTTDAKGSVITNSYDKAGRVTLREYNNLDTPSVFYYYDGTGLATTPPTTQNFAKGKLTKVMSSISTTQYTSFDNFGRNLVSQQLTDGQTYESKYKYDFGGRMVEQTYPSGKVVRNFFENDGDLTKIVRQGKVYASDMSYTSAGILERIKLGNGLWESAKMNARQQVEEINLGTSPTDGSKWQVKYEYGEIDANGNTNISKNTGNISKQTINFAGLAQPFIQTYKYDALNRIIEAKENNGTPSGTQNWKQTYNYDRFGNRLNFSSLENGKAAITTTPQIDPNTNRFNLGQGFEYDKAGNIKKDTSTGIPREFVFNGDNKQVHVKDASGNPIGTYYYDGEGKRVKKTTASETTIFVYDGGGKLVAEYSTATPPTNPTVSYTATDPLGSPRVITDKNGNVTSRRDFMPFGEELNANNATNRLDTQKYNYGEDNVRKRFTGYEKDLETGLDFAEARYYNNKFARFTAVDPLLASGKSSNPQTFNRFVYCLNNPLINVDPTGMQVGRWMQPVLAGEYQYVKWGGPIPSNKDGSYNDVTSRNKAGELIGQYNSPQTGNRNPDLNDNVIRFNPMGPRSAENRIRMAGSGEAANESLTQFQRSGWDIIKSDDYGENHLATGQCNIAINEADIALMFTPIKGSSLIGAGVNRTGEQLAANAAERAVASKFESTALSTMEQAYSANGVVKTVAGYEVGGTFGKVGSTYNANIWGMFRTANSRSIFSFTRALETEAASTGASQISIQGSHIINPTFFNPANIQRASRLGYTFRAINEETIMLCKPLH